MTSILGRLFSVILILYYISVGKIYGFLVCLVVILFYQMDTTKWIMEGFFDTSCLSCANYFQKDSNSSNNIMTNENDKSDNIKYSTIIDIEDNINKRRKSEFQNRHCSISDNLTYKELPVKKDMSNIIYPEIGYDDSICNPCDKNCKYNIIT